MLVIIHPVYLVDVAWPPHYAKVFLHSDSYHQINKIMKISDIDQDYIGESVMGAAGRGLNRAWTAAKAKVGNASAQGLQRTQRMQKAMNTGFKKWLGQMRGEKPTFKNLAIFLQQLGFDKNIASQAASAVSGTITEKIRDPETLARIKQGVRQTPPNASQIAAKAQKLADKPNHPPTGKGDTEATTDQQYEVFATAIAMATKQGKIPQKLQKYLT